MMIEEMEDRLCQVETERDKYKNENLKLTLEISSLQAKLLCIKKEFDAVNKLLETV